MNPLDPATVSHPLAGGRVTVQAIARPVRRGQPERGACRFTQPQAEARLSRLGVGWTLWGPLTDGRWLVVRDV